MTSNAMLRVLLGFAMAAGAAACGGTAPPEAAPAPAPAPAPTPAPAPAPAPARQSPPPPLPARPIEFPAFRESTLPNGMRLIVVEQHDQPVANVNLYVKSGAANDPVVEAGLAGMVAEMLTKGTPRRTAEQIARTIEGVGGDLVASASEDYTRVGASVLADQLPLAFELVSDVVLRPTFPRAELDIVRTRALSALQAELAEPGAVAARRFMREVYGEEHPYSLAPLPQTLRAIERQDLVDFHRRHFKADDALLVISGAVNAAQVEQLVRRHFGQWQGGGVPEPSFVEPPAREASRIYLVHRPGSVQSNILVGHVGIRPDNPDYYPLQVLNKIVGGGTDARLFQILREEKGWTYGAYSQLSRPQDVGYFRASAEVRNEVTDSALVEMLRQLRRVRDEPVPPQELEAARSYLVGSFPLRIETPGQIAQQVAQVRLLGLPMDALTQYRERIAAVTAEDVQRVARQYVRPDQAAIVVVGDATQVYPKLQGIAPVSIFSVEGEPMQMSDLEVKASGERFSAAALRPMTRTYRVLVQGNPMGSATMSLARQDGAWVGNTTLQVGPMSQQSQVRFTDDLTPIAAQMTMAAGGMKMESDLKYADGRVTGQLQLPPQAGGERTVDTEVPQGTILSGMDEWVLAAAQLQPGKTITLPMFNPQSASVVNASFKVTGTESLTVPAGTFQAYRVEMSAGPQGGTVWVRQEAPHIVLKQDFAGQPVSIELESVK